MPHEDRQTRGQVEAKIRWTTYVDPTDGKDVASGVCVFGDYIAVVGWAEFKKSFLVLLRKSYTGPFLILLRKSDGGVVREWIGSEEGKFGNCISIGGKLYAIGYTKVGDDYYGVIYVFDGNLNILARVRSESPSLYNPLVYNDGVLYLGGWAFKDVDGDGEQELVGLVEKRALDESLSLVNSKKIYLSSWEWGWINDIGVEPSTGRIWAVGLYVDSNDKTHSLIVILDSDLRVLKVIDYPPDSEGFLGGLTGIAFDGRYVYVLGNYGVARFSLDGELVAINRDGKVRAKIVYGYIYLYTFGHVEIGGYRRHVLYIHDTDLKLVKSYVLSEGVNAHSSFDIGRPALEGNSIYVAGIDYALGEKNSRIAVYSLTLEGVTVPAPVAVTTTVPTTATAARVGLERVRVAEELVELLLSRRVGGLIGGYGCREGSKPRTVSLSKVVAPEGFDGVWSCCPLGCGGWGCAYRCEKGGEVVVFKVPRGFEPIVEEGFIPTVSEKVLKRVVEEANTIRALKHPNILRLYAASTKAPILVYEYADYGSVEWQISRGWKPSLEDVLIVAVQVGDALRYIHSRGLLHGDIKAGNIFLVGGIAKLGDFSSLTKLLAMTSSHSRLVYTPGWRAPEQVYSDLREKAKERGLEQRIDVYQLGNLILYMLTGETLDGEDALEEGRVADAVKSVEREELREVLMEALQPKPWDRPSSEELVKKLLEVYTSI